jgi:hypothetical protein
MSNRPIRPSVQKAENSKAAELLEREENIRFVIEMSPKDRRALKRSALDEGLTVRALLLGLAKVHGVPIEDRDADKAASLLQDGRR